MTIIIIRSFLVTNIGIDVVLFLALQKKIEDELSSLF